VPPVGVGGWNERLLVRLIVRACPVGTVITTGDHVVVAGRIQRGARGGGGGAGGAPQKYPHIGTVEPSAGVTLVGAAVRLMVCWPKAATAAKGRILVFVLRLSVWF